MILVDSRKGILTQTRRHSYLVSLLGIKHVVLAVNKLDLVDYSQEVFDAITADYAEFAHEIGLDGFVAIPMSAYMGDNLTERSANTPWYSGPSLIEHLESVDIDDAAAAAPFRMPVQWVNRPDLDFRGFSGQIVSGTVSPGDPIRVLPSGKTSTVERIVTMGGDLDVAGAGRSVTITLADEIDISRGDVLSIGDNPPAVADQFEACIVWMGEAPSCPNGRSCARSVPSQSLRASPNRNTRSTSTLSRRPQRLLSRSTKSVCATSVSIDRSRSTRTSATVTPVASSSSTALPTALSVRA